RARGPLGEPPLAHAHDGFLGIAGNGSTFDTSSEIFIAFSSEIAIAFSSEIAIAFSNASIISAADRFVNAAAAIDSTRVSKKASYQIPECVTQGFSNRP
ncbi:MAG: hypothetical protein ABSE69_14585, partial [Roseiarcus sp.]